MYVLLVRLCDLVAPLVRVISKCILLHIRNSKQYFFSVIKLWKLHTVSILTPSIEDLSIRQKCFETLIYNSISLLLVVKSKLKGLWDHKVVLQITSLFAELAVETSWMTQFAGVEFNKKNYMKSLKWCFNYISSLIWWI